MKYEFKKSGGWEEQNPNADFYEDFYSEKSLKLPAGEYEVSATLNYSLDDEDIAGTEKEQTISTWISVKD